jgi:hypothetical protein
VAAQLHFWLAVASASVALFVGVEAVWRAIRGAPPGRAASRLEALLLLVVGVTVAGGVGILAGGGAPRELLHFVYAVLAFGTLPVLGRITARWEPRRRGLATLVAAAVTLAVVVRLAATG